jgi:uncharacterized protein YyaL (SSP411 family)
VSLIDWQPWHTAAFMEAQTRRRPVLLLLEAAWAPACAEAHDTIFARPDVQEAIASTSVAVRVDVDRRPDIADRYGLGHWPTLLCLTPEGLVLAGGTRLDHDLARRIRTVSAAFADGTWREGAVDRLGTGAATPGVPRGAADGLALVSAAVWRARDASTGTFRHHDVPVPQAAAFALLHALATGDAMWLSAALDTLASVAPAVLATGLAWPAPHARAGAPLPRLEDQADWLHLHARALRLDPHDTLRDATRALVHGLRRVFGRPDGDWAPWAGASRLTLVDASARTCRALLAAADALQQPDLAREAIEALERLAPQAYARAAGVAHVLEDGRARGPLLLDDALLLAEALLDADAWRADDVYRDLAEELLRTTRARLQQPSGALTDRVASLAGAGCVGRLAEPHHSIAGNAAAARLLVRLAPDGEASRDEALRVLQALAPAVDEAGGLAAPLGVAWHALGAAESLAAAW